MTARQEYPALLAQLSPDQAVHVLNDRVALIKQVNASVADWLQERRKIEDAYVQGLRKLASRPQSDGGASLGIFQIPWQRIVSGTENLAASHEILSQKIETDVETPLRRFNTSSSEIKAVTSSQANLVSIAKELESAQKRAAKSNRKAADAAAAEEASRSWESQAPYIYEQLQALDEHRINQLRDVLTQLQTHELDQVERSRTSAESCLNALLNVETADEIRAFAGKAAATAAAASSPASPASRRDTIARRRSSVAGSTRPSSSSASTQLPPAAPPPRLSQRNTSQSSTATGLAAGAAGAVAGVVGVAAGAAAASHNQQAYEQAPQTPQTPHKSKLGGLKRLGTVIKGRRSNAPPPPPSSEKREKKARPFSTFRRGESSQSFQDLEATGEDLPRRNTDESRNALSQVQSTVTETREEITPPPGSPQTEEAGARDATPAAAAAAVNGTGDSQQAAPPASTLQTRQGQSTDELAVLQPQPVQEQHLAGQGVSVAVPPTTLHHQQQETSLATDSEEGTRNFAIRDQPIHEDEGAAHLAINSMAQQLRIQAQSSGVNRSQGTVRGRRDVRNTIFVPSGGDSAAALTGGAAVGGVVGAVGAVGAGAAALAAHPSAHSQPSIEQSSPIPRMPTLRSHHDDVGVGSDTTSIHSTQSHSVVGQPHHPELHEPGLNASIIETVNSWFDESGITKSFVTGEIALAYNSTGNGNSHSNSNSNSNSAYAATSPNADIELIRLQHFELLEKVAANPVFISPPPKTTAADPSLASEDSAGTYTVALSSIRRSTPLVGLKYQLHIDAASLSQYSPLLITPAWQLIEGQASIIVQYALNPIFYPPASTTPAGGVTFRNVVISVSLDPSAGTTVQSAVMSPQQGATFRRKTASVTWRLPEFTVASDQQQSRLLVRFLTPGGTAKKGSIEVRFELPGRSGSKIGVLQRRLGSKTAAAAAAAAAAESDPFADHDGEDTATPTAATRTESEGWEEVSTKRVLVSGRYTAV